MPARIEPHANVLTERDHKFDALLRDAAKRYEHLAVDAAPRKVSVRSAECEVRRGFDATIYAARLQ